MTAISIFDISNTVLILLLLAMLWWFIHRQNNVKKIWDEIGALQLRLRVHEQTAPCEHCRTRHPSSGIEDCGGC